MSNALSVTEALAGTLDAVILATLAQARRGGRSTTCPVCDGVMRRLVDASAGVAPAPDELTCGECGSVLVDPPTEPVGQLRLVT
jgi:hypothetical protein